MKVRTLEHLLQKVGHCIWLTPVPRSQCTHRKPRQRCHGQINADFDIWIIGKLWKVLDRRLQKRTLSKVSRFFDELPVVIWKKLHWMSSSLTAAAQPRAAFTTLAIRADIPAPFVGCSGLRGSSA